MPGVEGEMVGVGVGVTADSEPPKILSFKRKPTPNAANNNAAAMIGLTGSLGGCFRWGKVAFPSCPRTIGHPGKEQVSPQFSISSCVLPECPVQVQDCGEVFVMMKLLPPDLKVISLATLLGSVCNSVKVGKVKSEKRTEDLGETTVKPRPAQPTIQLHLYTYCYRNCTGEHPIITISRSA